MAYITDITEKYRQEFPNGPAVRTQTLTTEDWGSSPGWGAKILQAAGVAIKKRRETYHLTVLKSRSLSLKARLLARYGPSEGCSRPLT